MFVKPELENTACLTYIFQVIYYAFQTSDTIYCVCVPYLFALYHVVGSESCLYIGVFEKVGNFADEGVIDCERDPFLLLLCLCVM